MALFITSKVHLTFYNFIIPTIHNIYDASTVTIVQYLAGFITQPKIHLTIRADKAVQSTSSHLLHTLFCKNLVFVFCCVWCSVYCCNEKKGGGGLTEPISWSCVKHFITHSGPFTWSIQPSWLLPFRPALKWIVHPVLLDELFFNQWRELNAITDRLMHINLIRFSINFYLLPFVFDSVFGFSACVQTWHYNISGNLRIIKRKVKLRLQVSHSLCLHAH